MKGTPTKTSSEPMGIIISGGPRTEQVPVFSAYIWAPAPQSTETDVKAA